MDATKLRASIQLAEGLKLKPYEDNGRIDIGYGHNLTAKGISSAIAEWLLNDDLVEAERGLSAAWQTFGSLDDVRQRAFVELAFNLGISGLLGFRKMIHAASVKDWQTASAELLASAASEQEPARFQRLALMITSGEDV